nr:MAG TPA: hypothetical protein [Caudoviricetes sp.]
MPNLLIVIFNLLILTISFLIDFKRISHFFFIILRRKRKVLFPKLRKESYMPNQHK